MDSTPNQNPSGGVTDAPEEREVPSGTTPAARISEAAVSSTPTPTVAKGVTRAAARPAGAVLESKPDPPVNKTRRRIVWASIAGFLATCFLMFTRFFLPRRGTLQEPATRFRIGFPDDYAIGVDDKWQQQYRI
ncbi:MAG TPA: hypothetical protein VJT74_08775 [Pyrinomonadaceae bacterium]|nr:hypothetical protein [Pyrinomonadaceae bacterium]